MARAQNDVVWGVEFGGSAVRLVRVARTGPAGPLRVDRYLEAAQEQRWETGSLAPSPAAAVARMEAGRTDEPLAACVGDELVLFRTLSLPERASKRAKARSRTGAGSDALAKMIRGQLEVLIPTQIERFVSGYVVSPDPYKAGWQRVVVCAARREALAGAMEGCKRLGREPEGTLPSILALAAAWSRLAPRGRSGRPARGDADPHRDGDSPAETTVLLDVGARCTSLAVVDDGPVPDAGDPVRRLRVVGCGVIDQGGDHWTERIAEELQISCQRAEVRKLEYAAASADRPAAEADPAVHACVQQAMADWAQQLREAYEDCVGTIPPHRRPGRCVLFGRSARMPGLPALAAETLGVQAEPLLTDGLELAEGIDLGSSAPAIGAAMWAMAGDWPTVSLTGPSEDQLRRRGRFRGLQRRLLPVGRSSWRWAALIVWLLAAVAALYGLDKVEANRLEDTLRDFRAKTGGHAGQGAESANPQDNLARQLAIGTYLEMAGPTPLEVLDRISQIVPKQLLLTYWHYSRSGEVIIRGTAPNEKEFAAMLGKLCEVGEVEWKSGRPDKGKFRFEIHLQVGRSMKPTTQEAPEGEAAPSKPSPATQPATQPASRPAAEPASSPASAPAAERQGGGS